MTLLEAAYTYIISILNADAVTGSVWLSDNIDKIQGIATIALCALVVVMAVWIGVSVLRWFGSLFNWRR